jgi:hypothetical protein
VHHFFISSPKSISQAKFGFLPMMEKRLLGDEGSWPPYDVHVVKGRKLNKTLPIQLLFQQDPLSAALLADLSCNTRGTFFRPFFPRTLYFLQLLCDLLLTTLQVLSMLRDNAVSSKTEFLVLGLSLAKATQWVPSVQLLDDLFLMICFSLHTKRKTKLSSRVSFNP